MLYTDDDKISSWARDSLAMAFVASIPCIPPINRVDRLSSFQRFMLNVRRLLWDAMDSIQRTVLARVRLDRGFTPLLLLYNNSPNIRSI